MGALDGRDLDLGASCLRFLGAEAHPLALQVGKANNPSLTNQLVDYLMGETDGEAKDHNYLFKLHMALGDYEQAAQTAVLIAKQEQEMGNYKLAHSQLLSTYRELRAQQKRVPAELTRSLMLLHSYILVKTLARSGDHKVHRQQRLPFVTSSVPPVSLVAGGSQLFTRVQLECGSPAESRPAPGCCAHADASSEKHLQVPRARGANPDLNSH